MTNQLSGDALSRAAAEAMGWSRGPHDGWPETLALRVGSPCKAWTELLYATDNRLLGEMLEWLSERILGGDRAWAQVDSHPAHGEWQVYCGAQVGDQCFRGAGKTPVEAAARCVVEVGRLLRERGQ